MSESAIRINGISKRYTLGQRRAHYETLRESIARAVVAPARVLAGQRADPSERSILWALRNVSFDVAAGESLGLVGSNGAGKSTLLKILSGITEPTAGRIEVRGRLASLLEVGTGFHPELTGRENIFMNGAMLGMSRREIHRKFDEIVAFSEIERFLDTPVKRYSSGMYTRLAFGVAAHLEPDILVVDEVLAVGDAAFQRKCIGKMDEIAHGGRTIIFVSHNMAAVSQLCSRAILIQGGEVRLDGPAPAVIAEYLNERRGAQNVWHRSEADDPTDTDNAIRVDRMSVMDERGDATASVCFDKGFLMEVEYTVLQPVRDAVPFLRIKDKNGVPVFTTWSTDAGGSVGARAPGRYVAVCHVPARLLRPGMYDVSVGARSESDVVELHEQVVFFEVNPVGFTMNESRIGIITPVLPWEESLVHDAEADQGRIEVTGSRKSHG